MNIAIKISLISLLLTLNVFAEQICLFKPPSKWKLADPNCLAKEVLVGFIGKGKKLNPSINLAHERLDIPFADYMNDVRKLHLKDGIINLGLIETKSGKVSLVSFKSKTKGGEMELLQAFIRSSKEVFVLTMAADKKDFLKLHETFLSALKSLQITDDLIVLVKEPKEREELKQHLAMLSEAKSKKKELASFEKFVLSHFDDLGDYWKFLVLKKGMKLSTESRM